METNYYRNELWKRALEMQKFYFFRALFSILISLTPSLLVPINCHAELWQGGQTLQKLKSSFGLHSQLYQVSNSQSLKMMTFGQFDYGQTDQVQIETRLGLGNMNYYLSVLSKYQIYSSKNGEAAVMGGLQFQTALSLTGDLIGSVHWAGLEFYGSIHIFTPLNGSAMGVGFIPGFDFKLNQWLAIYLEGDVNLANYYTAGSVGFRNFF